MKPGLGVDVGADKFALRAVASRMTLATPIFGSRHARNNIWAALKSEHHVDAVDDIRTVLGGAVSVTCAKYLANALNTYANSSTLPFPVTAVRNVLACQDTQKTPHKLRLAFAHAANLAALHDALLMCRGGKTTEYAHECAQAWFEDGGPGDVVKERTVAGTRASGTEDDDVGENSSDDYNVFQVRCKLSRIRKEGRNALKTLCERMQRPPRSQKAALSFLGMFEVENAVDELAHELLTSAKKLQRKIQPNFDKVPVRGCGLEHFPGADDEDGNESDKNGGPRADGAEEEFEHEDSAGDEEAESSLATSEYDGEDDDDDDDDADEEGDEDDATIPEGQKDTDDNVITDAEDPIGNRAGPSKIVTPRAFSKKRAFQVADNAKSASPIETESPFRGSNDEDGLSAKRRKLVRRHKLTTHLSPINLSSPMRKRTKRGNVRPNLKGRRQRYSPTEDELIIQGLKKFGWGEWQLILESCTWDGERTNVNLKDRARSLGLEKKDFPKSNGPARPGRPAGVSPHKNPSAPYSPSSSTLKGSPSRPVSRKGTPSTKKDARRADSEDVDEDEDEDGDPPQET